MPRPLRTSSRRSQVVAGLALLAVGVLPAAAQSPRAVGTWRPVADLTAGWHAFGPILLSATAVAGVGTGTLDIPEPGTNFVLAALEPGIFGGRASLVYAHWWGFEGGLIARGTVLRFWRGTPKRTYVGAEVQYVISLLPVGIRIGAYRPTHDTPRPARTLWLADMSVMY